MDSWGEAAASPAGVALVAVGAFYALAGAIAARATLFASFLDAALDALAPHKANPAERERTLWLAGGAALVFAAGVALVLLLPLAPLVFGLALAHQALYLFFVAPRRLDPFDPPDPAGRRRSANAALVFAFAFAVVLWAGISGRLAAESGAWPMRTGLFAAATAAFCVWLAARVLRPLMTRRQSTELAESEYVDERLDDDPDGALPELVSVLVMAEYGCWPLWVDHGGGRDNEDPAWLGLSEALAGDLGDWQDRFAAAWDMDDPATGPRWNDGQQRQHDFDGLALAKRLAAELEARGDAATVVSFRFSTGEDITLSGP